MDRQFFSGNTLEQAVLAAARHHGLEPERVAYTMRDKKHGFVNVRRRVVIEVDPDAPELAEGAGGAGESSAGVGESGIGGPGIGGPGVGGPGAGGSGVGEPGVGEAVGAQPRRDERPGPGERSGDEGRRGGAGWRGKDLSLPAEQTDASGGEIAALERAVDELGGLLSISVETSIGRDEDGYEIEIAGPESAVLREHRGSGLGAIEHLLPRMVRGLSGQGVPCRVDSEGFRAAHEEELSRLALSTAEDVCDEFEERRLAPMNPADRRVVHMTLADHPEVTTESEGQGFMKRVRIIPL